MGGGSGWYDKVYVANMNGRAFFTAHFLAILFSLIFRDVFHVHRVAAMIGETVKAKAT